MPTRTCADQPSSAAPTETEYHISHSPGDANKYRSGKATWQWMLPFRIRWPKHHSWNLLSPHLRQPEPHMG